MIAREDRYRTKSQARRVVLISGDNTRTFTIRPWVAATVGVVGATLSVSFLAATAYLVFRDDLINTAFSRNASLQQAYEDRIASLRSEIDKIASRQILDQIAYDEKVERLISAQRSLDDRQRVVADLIERAKASGLLADADGAPADQRADALGPAADPKADLAAGTAYAPDGGTEAAVDRQFAALTSTPQPLARAIAPAPAAAVPVVPLTSEGKIDVPAVTADLARIDAEQTAAVRLIAAAARARADEVVGIVGRLGVTLKVAAIEPAAGDAADAVGGPYVPLQSAEALTDALADAELAFGMLGQVKTAIARLPIVPPLEGASMTSNFGSRTDPFLGSAAFHAGIDFRSPSGRPVEATASGRVIAAGPNGGYGNMVEIDHGKGLTTRYAHLSRILVEVGDKVGRGDVIGKVGSTGRSTGPHLHYETRVNGAAVNPATYLTAGRKIESILE
jgi:murein DD-endopeptidase MepM/ murein hydrolase activator NlpD